jgi:hypothetical protein
MHDIEKEDLIRRYAARESTWHELRERGFGRPFILIFVSTSATGFVMR